MNNAEEIEPVYAPRFVTQQQLHALAEYYRMTAVGTTNWRPTRAGRVQRAVEMWLQANPGAASPTGAYKDLLCSVEQGT